jgi:hypothetical protein
MVVDVEEARLHTLVQVTVRVNGTHHLTGCVWFHVRNACDDYLVTQSSTYRS